MPAVNDGPSTSRFSPVAFKGNYTLTGLSRALKPGRMRDTLPAAPRGSCVSWGIPFEISKRVVLIRDKTVNEEIEPLRTQWLVFLHTANQSRLDIDEKGAVRPRQDTGGLGERAANYVILYADGSEISQAILRRHHIGSYFSAWGANCVQAVAHRKPRPVGAHHEQGNPSWGMSQTRVSAADRGSWVNWLYAWENPHPNKRIVGIRFEPVAGVVMVSAISSGRASSHPLRWESRQKAVVTLKKGHGLKSELDENGLLDQIRIDMGQVISAQPRPLYPDQTWSRTYNNRIPEISEREVLIEYTAHRDAKFHVTGSLAQVSIASRRVRLKVVRKDGGEAVAAKLHIHGESGEYLSPVDRHRMPNPAWFEDYAPEFIHLGLHRCAYIDGETTVDLPRGRVYIEVSKGFEMRPVRKVVTVRPSTKEIVIEIEKSLTWRENGWVTADTHVHFLSPQTAMLEGAAEGVNVVNLLASQWGELMTNAGDFDGKTTHGATSAGGDGEYLVRVGTENRQHVMGHISLLGYGGSIIAPMTTGGPDESALGDPVEILLTEWAAQCREQGGIVVIPHFPHPRLEHAATIVSGLADGVEMTAWGDLYSGIDPYSLSDWYRYLNCGHLVAAVAGTDKMTATTAVGTVRTYAQIDPNVAFTYAAWMDAVRQARTFVTYGPLVEFAVEGNPAGSRIPMSSGGGTVHVTWHASSVTVPMSRIELVVNGEIRESKSINRHHADGSFSCKVDRSSWLALLVRGHYKDKPEMIAAHTSPVMVDVEGSAFFSNLDAVTILEQIGGALAYIDTVATRAQAEAYKRMRLVLTAAQRDLHNRLHAHGHFHDHSPVDDHSEHHR